MKGLIIKDFLLLKKQMMFLIVVILIGIFMVGTGMDAMFITSYMVFILSNLALSTISYDEYDNGAPYLFSLPVTRTLYVKEKYIFSLINCVGGWLLSMLLVLGYMRVQNPSADMGAFWFNGTISLFCALVFVSTAIPIWIKLGPEKGRITYFVLAVSITLAVLLTKKLLNGRIDMEVLTSMINSGHKAPVLVEFVIGIIVLLGLGISYLITLRIVKHKEF